MNECSLLQTRAYCCQLTSNYLIWAPTTNNPFQKGHSPLSEYISQHCIAWIDVNNVCTVHQFASWNVCSPEIQSLFYQLQGQWGKTEQHIQLTVFGSFKSFSQKTVDLERLALRAKIEKAMSQGCERARRASTYSLVHFLDNLS